MQLILTEMFPNAKTKLSWYSDYQSFSCRKNLFSWHNNFFLAVESNFLLQEKILFRQAKKKVGSLHQENNFLA